MANSLTYIGYTKPENPIEGTFYYDQGTRKIMFFQNGEWVIIDNQSITNDFCKMSLYDLNQQIMSQLDPLMDDNFNAAMDLIDSWCEKEPDDFYMLLNNDLRYYTVFSARSKKNMEFHSLGEAVLVVMRELGAIRSVDLTSDSNAIEIWTDYEDTPQCFMLFPYDKGIVEYRR